MNSKVRIQKDLNFGSDNTIERFGDYLKISKDELYKYSRSYLEPVISSNNTITKWVTPFDKTSVEIVDKEFIFGNQKVTIPFKKGKFYEVDGNGNRRTEYNYLLALKSEGILETRKNFHELGALIEPTDVRDRALIPEFINMDIPDQNGLALVGTRLANEYHGVITQEGNPNIDYSIVSGIHKMNHALRVIHHERKASLYKNLIKILKDPSARSDSKDILANLGVDNFAVKINEATDGFNTGATIRGVSQGQSNWNPMQFAANPVESDMFWANQNRGNFGQRAGMNTNPAKPTGTGQPTPIVKKK